VYFTQTLLNTSSHLQDQHYETRTCPFQHLHQFSSWATYPGNAHFRHFQNEVSKITLNDAHLHRDGLKLRHISTKLSVVYSLVLLSITCTTAAILRQWPKPIQEGRLHRRQVSD